MDVVSRKRVSAVHVSGDAWNEVADKRADEKDSKDAREEGTRARGEGDEQVDPAQGHQGSIDEYERNRGQEPSQICSGRGSDDLRGMSGVEDECGQDNRDKDSENP